MHYSEHTTDVIDSALTKLEENHKQLERQIIDHLTATRRLSTVAENIDRAATVIWNIPIDKVEEHFSAVHETAEHVNDEMEHQTQN